MKIKVLTSEQCSCCVTYRPKIERIASEYGIPLEFEDINDNPSFVDHMGEVCGLPFTFITDSEGGVFISYPGDLREDIIRQRIERVIDGH